MRTVVIALFFALVPTVASAQWDDVDQDGSYRDSDFVERPRSSGDKYYRMMQEQQEEMHRSNEDAYHEQMLLQQEKILREIKRQNGTARGSENRDPIACTTLGCF